MRPPEPRGGYAAAGISRCVGRRDRGVADRGTGAARPCRRSASSTADHPTRWRAVCVDFARVLKMRASSKRRTNHRIPLGGKPNRTPAGAGGRSGPSAGRGDRRVRRLPAASAAKAATTTIPIVFLVGADPVRLGLVTSLGRPTGNLTGINLFNSELEAKRLELLHELVPRAARIAVLVNPSERPNTEATLQDLQAAASAMKLKVQFFNADTPNEIDTAFANLMREKPDALFYGSSAFMNIRRVQLVQLAAFHRLPATYSSRESVESAD